MNSYYTNCTCSTLIVHWFIACIIIYTFFLLQLVQYFAHMLFVIGTYYLSTATILVGLHMRDVNSFCQRVPSN
jgi:hypothetical protein